MIASAMLSSQHFYTISEIPIACMAIGLSCMSDYNLGVYHHTSGIELRFPNDFQGDFCR